MVPPTPQQLVIAKETARILRSGPFVAITLVAAYRNDAWTDRRLIRFAHATMRSETDFALGIEGLALLPIALRTVASELDEKRKQPFVRVEPTTPWQRLAAEELQRVAGSGGSFASLALTAALRESNSSGPSRVGVTHASALDDQRPRTASLALDQLPSTLRQIADQIQFHTTRRA